MKRRIRRQKTTRTHAFFDTAKDRLASTWSSWKALSWWKKALIIIGPPLIILIIAAGATYAYYANDIADKDRLLNRNNSGIVLTDVHGEVLYSTGRAEERVIVPLKDIPDTVKNALIASEDKDFYDHGGFNLFSIVRALWTNVISGDGKAYGGSTLTQQLAKSTVLSEEKTYLRKFQELAISIAIEQRYSKDEILEMYLNTAYYGEGAFGIEEAARVYYAKKPQNLTLAESAELIGLLPAPSAYSPISGNKEYANERRSTVLQRMEREGYITQKQRTENQSIAIAHQKPQTSVSEAPHFVQMVLSRIAREYDQDTAQRAGYRVKTTLDLKKQRALQQAVKNNIGYITANGGSNASAVAIDPETGEIRALVGSADWENEKWGKVNMVTSERQPGSTYKALYYAGALADGVITPATVLRDEPTDFGGGYRPLNADRRFYGDITVRNAINRSLNIPSVKVMQRYGLQRSIELSNRLGVTIDESREFGLSLALGVSETSLLKMTNAYATFANQGVQHTNSSIVSIKDKFDNAVFTQQHQGSQVIDESGAYLISHILSDEVSRGRAFGTALNVAGHTAAVKTGTTEDARDAWTIGYTPDLAIGVWVGNNDNTPMNNGGSSMAGPIWRNAMAEMLRDVQDRQFSQPASVVVRSTCYSNYGLATNAIKNGTFNEYYLTTALPTASCTPEEPKPIEVCIEDERKIVSIKEEDFDDKKHTKDLKKCQKEEVEKIMICNLNTGERIEVSSDESYAAVFTSNLDLCPPDPAASDDQDNADTDQGEGDGETQEDTSPSDEQNTQTQQGNN